MLVYILAVLMICAVVYCVYQMWPTKTDEHKCEHLSLRQIGIINDKVERYVFWCPVCGSLGLMQLDKPIVWSVPGTFTWADD